MPDFLITNQLKLQIEAIQQSTMDYTCSIERNNSISDDSWKNENPADYQPLPDRVACSYKPQMTEIDQKTGQFVSVPAKMKMPLDTDIRLTDRVIDIQDRNGIGALPFRFEITSITPKIGHKSLIVQAIGD
jgi:hypothetical protein